MQIASFKIPPGSPARMIKHDVRWSPDSFTFQDTTKTLEFDERHLVIDPIGQLIRPGIDPMAEIYAKCGFFGFLSKGWILVVNKTHVEFKALENAVKVTTND